MKIPVARFNHKKDNVPQRLTLTWETLRKNLTLHEVRAEKNGPLWSPALYRPDCARGIEGVESVSAFVLDHDKGTPVEEFFPLWERWEYVVHSTHSSTPETPTWRAVFPLASLIPSEEWPQVYAKLLTALGGGKMDKSCKDCSRAYFTPAHPPGAAPFTFTHSGEWLDPAEFPDPAPEAPLARPFKIIRPAASDDQRPSTGLLLAQALDEISEGRHNRALHLAQQLRDNRYTESEAEPVMREFVSLCPASDTKGKHDPFTDAEGLKVLREMYAHPPREGWGPPRRVLGSGGVGAAVAMFPCLRTLSGLSSTLMIETRHRDDVLFAFTSQCKAQVTSPEWAEMAIWSVNTQRCREPLEKDEFLELFRRAWASNHSHPHCDLVQQANLCPVLLYGEQCAAHQQTEKQELETRKALAADPTSLTITPLSVLRTEPPIYTATIRGRKVQFSLEELCNFRLFKKHVLGSLDFIPICPVIWDGKTRLSDTKAWEIVVNEAMKTLTEEPAPPDDASPRGAVWGEIRAFLTSHGSISESRSDLARGRVVLSEVGNVDCYLFKGETLRRYLKLNRVDELSIGQVWKLIADKGGRNAMVDTPEGKERAYLIPTEKVREVLTEAD